MQDYCAFTFRRIWLKDLILRLFNNNDIEKVTQSWALVSFSLSDTSNFCLVMLLTQDVRMEWN